MSEGNDPVVEAELWNRYRASSDTDARNRLFAMHMSWAASVGRSVYHRVSVYSLDCADFVQNAELGMLDAMMRFDPKRGIDFRAYAMPRVRGAVFNGVRALLHENSVSWDDRRFAERLSHLHDDNADAFDNVVDAIVGLGIGYLLEHAGSQGGNDGYAYVRRDQTNARLTAAMNRLPPRLREVVAAHYFEHIPFNVIATNLRLSKGRISQLHREALDRLRDALRDLA